jgi:hypothetical protein
MRDAAYVTLGLALCMCIFVVHDLIQRQKPVQSMMDLKEFKTLPYELRSAIRRTMPDPTVIRQQWGRMTPDQKRLAIQNMVPQPHMHAPPAPTPPVPVKKGLKRGFLNTNKNKKKDAEDEKHQEVGTLSTVGSVTVEETGLTEDTDSSFLGSDD